MTWNRNSNYSSQFNTKLVLTMVYLPIIEGLKITNPIIMKRTDMIMVCITNELFTKGIDSIEMSARNNKIVINPLGAIKRRGKTGNFKSHNAIHLVITIPKAIATAQGNVSRFIISWV